MKIYLDKVKAAKEILILGTIIMGLITGGSTFLWAKILSPLVDDKIECKLEPIQNQLNILINIEKYKVMEKYAGDREKYEKFCNEVDAAKK